MVSSNQGGLMLAWLRTRARGPVDAGATLAEVMVVAGIIGSLASMTVWGIRGWATANAFSGAPLQIQSVMRSAQQQAITEGKDFCVYFDVGLQTYAVYRSKCTGTDHPAAGLKTAGPWGLGSNDLELKTPTFTDTTNVDHAGVTFLPRGTAWAGSVWIWRGATSHQVHVERMTGRVSTT